MSVESLRFASDLAARRRLSVTIALVVLVVLLALLSLAIGPVRLSPPSVDSRHEGYDACTDGHKQVRIGA